MNLTEDIDSIQFEKLCYDLLQELGFIKLSWRRGTTLNASPADQGRDIEAVQIRHEVDGSTTEEHWFVECKQYKQGLPPQALQGALTWAESANPDTLLIMVSGYLSNSCKNYLQEYQQNRKPRFRILTWEFPDLERMLLGRPRLLEKFGLAPEFPYINILHPAHKQFLRKPPINTIDYFLKLADELDREDREVWLSDAYLLIINPEFEKPTSGDQVLGELLKSPVTYHEFKKALKKSSSYVSEILLVHGVISKVLSGLLNRGDVTGIQEFVDFHRSAIDFFEEQIKNHPERQKPLEDCIKMSKAKIGTIEDDLKKGYETYVQFCDQFLVPLFDERISIPEHLEQEMINNI